MPQGTGERTGNLFDPNSTRYEYAITDASKIVSYSGGAVYILPAENGETYTFKIHALASVRLLRMAFYDYENPINNDVVYNLTQIRDTEKPQITLVNSGNHPYIIVQVAGEFIDNYGTNSFMLNAGSTAHPYEPYGYKIPISSANITTLIYLGEVETTRKIKKLVLDGTENWSESPCNIGYRFVIPITSAMQSDTTIGVRSICTHQILVKTGETYNRLGAYTISAASELLMTLNSDTRLASWKSWLAAQYAADTPVTIWYVLATPETAVVNEPLMKIGGYADTLSMEQAGVSIPTLNGQTVVDVGTTLKPSKMYIKYKE
jgi:hypothetical protein